MLINEAHGVKERGAIELKAMTKLLDKRISGVHGKNGNV